MRQDKKNSFLSGDIANKGYELSIFNIKQYAMLCQEHNNQDCTANLFPVKTVAFPCVTLVPCKVHIIVTGKPIEPISLQR